MDSIRFIEAVIAEVRVTCFDVRVPESTPVIVYRRSNTRPIQGKLPQRVLWNLYRKLRYRVTWEVKRAKGAKIQYFEKISEQSSGNPRKMWKELNRVLGRESRQKIEA